MLLLQVSSIIPLEERTIEDSSCYLLVNQIAKIAPDIDPYLSEKRATTQQDAQNRFTMIGTSCIYHSQAAYCAEASG